jgi:hypothetical protein
MTGFRPSARSISSSAGNSLRGWRRVPVGCCSDGRLPSRVKQPACPISAVDDKGVQVGDGRTRKKEGGGPCPAVRLRRLPTPHGQLARTSLELSLVRGVEGAFPYRVIGNFMLPAVPDDAEPGAGEHSSGGGSTSLGHVGRGRHDLQRRVLQLSGTTTLPDDLTDPHLQSAARLLALLGATARAAAAAIALLHPCSRSAVAAPLTPAARTSG